MKLKTIDDLESKSNNIDLISKNEVREILAEIWKYHEKQSAQSFKKGNFNAMLEYSIKRDIIIKIMPSVKELVKR